MCDHCETPEEEDEEEDPGSSHTKKKNNKMATCSACRSSHYCSRACQRAHWGAHKQVCRHFIETRDRIDADVWDHVSRWIRLQRARMIELGELLLADGKDGKDGNKDPSAFVLWVCVEVDGGRFEVTRAEVTRASEVTHAQALEGIRLCREVGSSFFTHN